MTTSLITCHVRSFDAEICRDTMTSVLVPTPSGWYHIYPDHASTLMTLGLGVCVFLRQDTAPFLCWSTGGVLEFRTPKTCNVLFESTVITHHTALETLENQWLSLPIQEHFSLLDTTSEAINPDRQT